MGQHDLRPFLTTPAIYTWLEGVKNSSFFRSKSGRYGRPVPGQGIQLETILCAISPSNTWNSMTLDHFWPFFTTQAIHQYLEGVKNGSFFRSKSDNYGRLVAGQGTRLETIFCAISPTSSWNSMTLDHFWPPQPYINIWRVSKMAIDIKGVL